MIPVGASTQPIRQTRSVLGAAVWAVWLVTGIPSVPVVTHASSSYTYAVTAAVLWTAVNSQRAVVSKEAVKAETARRGAEAVEGAGVGTDWVARYTGSIWAAPV